MLTKRKVCNRLNQAQKSARDVGDVLCQELNSVTHHTCSYLKSNPWAGVAVGAALGLIIGLSVSRR